MVEAVRKHYSIGPAPAARLSRACDRIVTARLVAAPGFRGALEALAQPSAAACSRGLPPEREDRAVAAQTLDFVLTPGFQKQA